MAAHMSGVNANSVLLPCTGVFTKTLGLPCKHKIQESLRNPDYPLRHGDLHPHWWLNPLEDEQPVEPWARIQPPVRTRRRGRPRNPQREPSAFEVAQAQAAARTQNQANFRSRGADNRGHGRAARGGRGGNGGRGRNRGRSQSLEAELQTRRAGLRQRGRQVQGDILDDE